MPIVKTPDADLRSQYKTVSKLSLIISMSVILIAFNFFPVIDDDSTLKRETPQELFTVEDIQSTRHENKPPPPKPVIPVKKEKPDTKQEVELINNELDAGAENQGAPPPMIKEEKKVIVEKPVYFVAVEVMPEPYGGIQAIQSKLIYPPLAKQNGVEGKVYVLAFIDEDGFVRNVRLVKGIGSGCDEAALDAVRKTKFKPGKKEGVPVKVQMSIQLTFKLP
jgi:protein TonB